MCFLKVEMSELASAETLVLTVSATDRDSGLNGKITYRLLSSPLQGFYIQPDTGTALFDGLQSCSRPDERKLVIVEHMCIWHKSDIILHF